MICLNPSSHCYMSGVDRTKYSYWYLVAANDKSKILAAHSCGSHIAQWQGQDMNQTLHHCHLLYCHNLCPLRHPVLSAREASCSVFIFQFLMLGLKRRTHNIWTYFTENIKAVLQPPQMTLGSLHFSHLFGLMWKWIMSEKARLEPMTFTT